MHLAQGGYVTDGATPSSCDNCNLCDLILYAVKADIKFIFKGRIIINLRNKSERYDTFKMCDTY